jgi:glycosyltransferase involved in cell wall biosynthesis
VTRVSVILPCRNEARYIDVCLESVIAAEFPKDQLELLVVDGQSNDGTAALVQRYAARHPWIRLLENPRRIVPAALNIGIREARGEIIIRMDAHVVYPPEYIPRLVAALEATGADNVGGGVITLPASRGAMARAIAVALSHPFGVGNSWFRIGARENRWVDTVPFGCWRRELFQRIGPFDEELVRNQDDELNYRITREGGRVLLVPGVIASYYARESPGLTARMLFQYGYFKPLVALKVGRVATLRQLAPPLLVAALLGSALLALAWRPALPVLGFLLLAYGTAIAAAAAGQVRPRGIRVAAALAVIFPLLHLSYGWGYLRGLWSILVTRRARWRDPAAVPLTR